MTEYAELERAMLCLVDAISEPAPSADYPGFLSWLQTSHASWYALARASYLYDPTIAPDVQRDCARASLLERRMRGVE